MTLGSPLARIPFDNVRNSFWMKILDFESWGNVEIIEGKKPYIVMLLNHL